jgi:hypothetical protein
MSRDSPSSLIERIEAYMRRTKMSQSRFGRDCVGDPNFVTSLREGRSPRRPTVVRVIAYIEGRSRPRPPARRR